MQRRNRGDGFGWAALAVLGLYMGLVIPLWILALGDANAQGTWWFDTMVILGLFIAFPVGTIACAIYAFRDIIRRTR